MSLVRRYLLPSICIIMNTISLGRDKWEQVYNNYIIMMYIPISYGLHRASEQYLHFKTCAQSFAPWPQIVIAIRLS